MNHISTRVILVLCLACTLMAGCSRESKKVKIQQRAEAHLKAGDYDRAEIEYKNLLRLEPTNQVALRNLGVMFSEQGRLVDSYRLLSNARKVFPDDLEVRLKYGLTLLAARQPKQSREEAIQLLSLQPTNQEALLLLVECSSTAGDLDDAQQRLASLRGTGGETASIHVALGALQLRKNETNAALESFRKALSLDPKSSAAHMAMGSLFALRKELTNAQAEFKMAADLSPDRSFHRVRYVDFLVSIGELAEAKQSLEQIKKKTPDYLPALLRLAQLALTERRFADCEDALKSLIARDPVHLDAFLTLARLRMAQNQPEKAIAELERVLKPYPRVPQVYYQMALAYLMSNDLAGAVRSLNEALTIQPDYPEATMLLAELNIRRGDTAFAVSALTRLVERRPGLTPAQLLLATAHRAAGKPELALAIYENLSRNYPTNAQPAFLMGLVLQSQGKKAEARKRFETALRYNPEYLSATEQLINLDLAEQRFADAQARAQREVDRSPTNTTPYLLLANVHLAQTNIVMAESVLLRALESFPESGPLNALLAKVYVANQKHEAAMKRLQEVVARNTNDLNSWMMIAELNSATSNYVAAGQAYDSILAANPRHGPALNNLAWLCSEHLQQPNRAYELASRARDLNPRNPFTAASTADTLGWVLFKNGDYVRALALIQESARILSEQPDVLFHLGMTHYMMGEESAARASLQSAIQLATRDSNWKPEAEQRLRVLDFDPVNANKAAVQELESLAAREPRDPILLARLGAVSEREGAWSKAVTVYENALQLNTNLVPVMVRLARLYSVQQKNPERAFALARRARTLEPDDPNIAHTLGRLAYDSAQTASDFQWAHGLLKESARSFSDDPDVLFDFALATYAMGDMTNAVVTMRKVTGPRVSTARLAEATQFLEMNELMFNPKEAIASASKVASILQKQPDYVPALRVNGLLQESNGDFRGARDSYERVLKIFPTFSPANRSLAVLYASHLGDPAKAYEYATKAREAFPQDLQVARVLGDLAYQRNELPRAVQLLKESVSAYAQDAELFYTLGVAHYKLKQSKESKDALTKAMSLSPGSPRATEAKRILTELK